MADIGFENTKLLKRDLKRAKVFAIHYLTRRIRLLKNKRGTEQQVEKNMRKVERFQEELEYVKVESGDVQERALARLILSKPIQNGLKDSNDKEDILTVRKKSTTDIVSTEKARHATSRIANFEKKKKKKKEQNHFSIPSDDGNEAGSKSHENSDKDILMKGTLTSFFVESLASIHKDDNKTKQSEYERKSKKKIKKSANRLGQRARQKLWKEKYGNLANHIKSDTSRTKTQKSGKVGLHKSPKPGTKRKDTKIEEKNVEETVSHPSWEASKRRKLQSDIRQTQFQGQKIKFEDSD